MAFAHGPRNTCPDPVDLLILPPFRLPSLIHSALAEPSTQIRTDTTQITQASLACFLSTFYIPGTVRAVWVKAANSENTLASAFV